MTGTLTPEAPATEGLLRWPPVVFLVATALGLVLRFGFLGLALPVPLDHLLHAHSHALYFGWAALVILAAAAYTKRMRRWAWAGLGLVPLLTVAFLLQGYGPFSIAVSTAVMLVWYGAVVSWWRHRGGDPLFGASFLYIVLASAGIWVLAGLQATGHGEGLAQSLAIHAFLSTFAWSLVLGRPLWRRGVGWFPGRPLRGRSAGWADWRGSSFLWEWWAGPKSRFWVGRREGRPWRWSSPPSTG